MAQRLSGTAMAENDIISTRQSFEFFLACHSESLQDLEERCNVFPREGVRSIDDVDRTLSACDSVDTLLAIDDVLPKHAVRHIRSRAETQKESVYLFWSEEQVIINREEEATTARLRYLESDDRSAILGEDTEIHSWISKKASRVERTTVVTHNHALDAFTSEGAAHEHPYIPRTAEVEEENGHPLRFLGRDVASTTHPLVPPEEMSQESPALLIEVHVSTRETEGEVLRQKSYVRPHVGSTILHDVQSTGFPTEGAWWSLCARETTRSASLSAAWARTWRGEASWGE